MSSTVDNLVEQKIRQAMEDGEFDHLSSKGKRIDLTDYFEIPEDIRLAYSVMKNAGVLPPEIELMAEIRDLEQLRTKLSKDMRASDIQSRLQDLRLRLRLQLERRRAP